MISSHELGRDRRWSLFDHAAMLFIVALGLYAGIVGIRRQTRIEPIDSHISDSTLAPHESGTK